MNRLKTSAVGVLKRRLPHRAGLWAVGAFEVLNRAMRRRIRRQLGIEPLETLDLLSTRRSDTVFIIGSGSSLNEIDDARWRQIAAFDSFGLNFSMRHPFVPTHYFFEAAYPRDFDQAVAVMETRREEYRHLWKIILPGFPQSAQEEREFQRLPAPWRENLWAGGVHRIFARTEAELDRSVRRLVRLGAFPIGQRHVGAVFKHMGSVSSLLALAANMQYRNIVLCGIDITNPDYFYDDSERYPDMVEYRDKVRLPGASLLRNRVTSEIRGDRVILALKRLVLDPAGSRLYVENSSSALHPQVEVAPPEIFGAPESETGGRGRT